jgi:hypothetical protein
LLPVTSSYFSMTDGWSADWSRLKRIRSLSKSLSFSSFDPDRLKGAGHTAATPLRNFFPLFSIASPIFAVLSFFLNCRLQDKRLEKR